MAELDEASKGSLSHRGQAFRALFREIVRFLGLA
jgi:inosine/xanthosine triphosphate pyrophosphatase family protein